jgi:hypothetical protein
MPNGDEGFVRATGEANEVFGRMQQVVTSAVKDGAKELNVLEIARESGIEIDEGNLAELQIPQVLPVIDWLPWHHWFCWRPLWCYWWRWHYPWYRCCPYWWYRCHWYPY